MAAATSLSLTLWDAEHDLASFFDTLEMVEPCHEQEFLEEFSKSLTTAQDKRDRVAHALTHLESVQQLAKQEIERLKLRVAVAEHAQAKLESYVVKVIESLGIDEKTGRYKKLEGKTTTLSIAGCPPSVNITDETLVPAEYKSACLKLPALLWEELLNSVDIELRDKVLTAIKSPDLIVSKSQLKTALDSGAAVPGADLTIGRNRLVRK